MANPAIKCQLPIIKEKYRLLSPLECAAVPRNRYHQNAALEIQNKTGIKYINIDQYGLSIYSAYTSSFWQTVLPAGLIINFKGIHKYWNQTKLGYEFSFVIESKLNPGWPRFTCRVKEYELKDCVLEQI